MEIDIGLDPVRMALISSRPEPLPGGKSFVFSDNEHSFVYSFETGIATLLLRGATSPRFAGRRLLFMRGSDLLSVAFDPERLAVLSDPVLVAEGVRVEVTGQGQYAVDRAGTLAYAAGGHALEGVLHVVDADGHAEALAFAPGIFSPPTFSPDGRALAVGILDVTWDIWILDLETGTRRRITTEGNNQSPVWTGDGERIFFASDRAGSYDLYSIGTQGGDSPSLAVSDDADLFQPSIAADGTLLLARAPRGEIDLLLVPPSVGEPRELIPFAEQTGVSELLARLSPAGNRVGYTSDVSGRYEVYVAPRSGDGGRVQVSVEGGEEAAWSPAGDRVYFRNGTALWSVPVFASGSALRAGSPELVFDDPDWVNLGGHSYDVRPNGVGFLIVRSDQEHSAAAIRIVESR